MFELLQESEENGEIEEAGFHTGFFAGGETFSELQISPAPPPQKICTTTCKATALILKLVGFDSFHVVTLYMNTPISCSNHVHHMLTTVVIVNCIASKVWSSTNSAHLTAMCTVTFTDLTAMCRVTFTN